MSKNDKIIGNINVSISMEDTPLTQKDKDRIRKCLESELSFQDTIDKVLEYYIKEQQKKESF